MGLRSFASEKKSFSAFAIVPNEELQQEEGGEIMEALHIIYCDTGGGRGGTFILPLAVIFAHFAAADRSSDSLICGEFNE